MDKLPLMSRRTIMLFAAIAASWCALAWIVSGWVVQDRTAALIARETGVVRVDVANISENFERVLNRLQGLPAVLASGSDITKVLSSFGSGATSSPLPREQRMAAWTQRPDLVALNRQLLAVVAEMDVDIVWVINTNGDCVAASNSGEATSFVGTNYADRSYFQSAREGKRGRQYAMGRVTNVPGLFFSAPVVANGVFLGAVVIKIDLPRLAPWVHHPHAFVTDEYGVIIMAANKALEMRALPGAAVHGLSADRRQARYKRERFDTLGTTAAGADGLMLVDGSPLPHVTARSERPQHGIAVHILAPIEHIDNVRSDAFAIFLLLSFSGVLLTALVLGVLTYLSRVRQHRESMQATNTSLNTLNEHLNHLATMDPLTDVANRRHFQARLQEELGRAARYRRPCSLLLIDLDYFKQINDRHGHAGGDEVLRHFARTASGQLRNQDELGRLGGEEFGVLLPETDLKSAEAVAERIRAAIEATPTRFENATIAVTASFGAACWESAAETADALLQRADAALYAAKSGGRNRVNIASAVSKAA